MLEFGQTIKAKREQKGLTQKQLGQLLYVSDKTVSRWENNQIYPDITMLLDISKVLEIDYQELIEGSDYIEKKKAKQEQQLKRKKKGLLYFTAFMICVFLISSHYILKEKKIEETCIDYIVSKKWNEIGMTDAIEHEIFHVSHYISDYEKDRIIAYLDVDHWIRIDMLPKDAMHIDYQLAFYTPDNNKGEDYITYKKNETYYFVLHEDPSIVYQLPINPTEFTETFQILPKSEFSYNHSFNNKSSYSQLVENELLKVSKDIENENDNLFNYYVWGMDTSWYLFITSSKFDIQTLDIKEDTLYITGEKRLYSKPYLIGLYLGEWIYIDKIQEINKVYVNDELKCDLDQGLFNLDE